MDLSCVRDWKQEWEANKVIWIFLVSKTVFITGQGLNRKKNNIRGQEFHRKKEQNAEASGPERV
jgi:hypothetical protein